MKKEIIETIKEKVAVAKGIPTARIEYNCELPKDKNIKKDNFYGVPANFNDNMKKDAVNVIYTM